MKGKLGFTLIELLVVIIILGILVALAIPKFMTGQETARAAEAKRILGAIRGSEVSVQQITGSYTTSFNNLGIDASLGMTQTDATHCASKYWNYFIDSGTATDFNCTAYRLDVSRPSGITAGMSICINSAGNTWGTHPYASSST